VNEVRTRGRQSRIAQTHPSYQQPREIVVLAHLPLEYFRVDAKIRRLKLQEHLARSWRTVDARGLVSVGLPRRAGRRDLQRATEVGFQAGQMIAVDVTQEGCQWWRVVRLFSEVVDYGQSSVTHSSEREVVRRSRPLMSGNSVTMPLNVDILPASYHALGQR